MQPTTQEYQHLKQEFQELIDQCQVIKTEKEVCFQAYRLRIQRELAELSRERVLFDEKLNKIENVYLIHVGN
jgi:hypothetical protein